MYEGDEFPQAVCSDEKPHGRHLIVGTWRDHCPGRTTHGAQLAAAEAPAHVRADCPALPVGCERCTAPATVRAAFMPCPRACGVDIRDHHSSDKVNDGCDTGPMSASDMRDWFELRGAGLPGAYTTAELIAEHYGKTEARLEAEYDAICGPMA